MSDAEWLTVPDFADALGITASQVRELLRDGALASARRGERTTVQIPAGFIVEVDGEPTILGTLKGTLTLLRDAQMDDETAIAWLMTHEPELGMTPLDSLRLGQRAHVRRLAQALL